MNASVSSLSLTPLPDDERLRRAREWFDRLRTEGSADLPDFSPIDIVDASLTEAQKHAVGRAVATPDVFMLDTDAATGRRMAASIARQAAQRGERVLLVMPENELFRFTLDFPGLSNQRKNAGKNVTKPGGLLARLIHSVFGSRHVQNSPSPSATIQLPLNISLFSPESLMNDPRTWDRLVVCGTCEIARPLLCGLCARADRWVFIGNGMANHGDTANSVAATWQALASETWGRENGRLVCRLRALTKSQRQFLASEPLEDSPEIELRIYQPEDAAPELAEVIFPTETTLVAAKEFLARQLDEWPIDIDVADIAWSENSDQVTACTGCPGRHEPVPVEVNPGVRELVADCPGHDVPWSSCGVSFDRSAGWDRPKAELWVQEHCSGKTRRTVVV